MKLSDYNALRSHELADEPVSLEADEYMRFRQNENRERFRRKISTDYRLRREERSSSLAEVYTDAFRQNGINGADYLIIVPDEICDEMTPYYSAYVADISGRGTQQLRDELNDVHRHKHGLMTESEYEAAYEAASEAEDTETEEALDAAWQDSLMEAYGTDQMIVMVADLFVRDVDASDMKFVVTSVTFPLEYIALIFVFAALTVLAVQQLSDSAKYRFRYEVLKKLGMRKKEVDRVIFRQLCSLLSRAGCGSRGHQLGDRRLCRKSVCALYGGRGRRPLLFRYFSAAHGGNLSDLFRSHVYRIPEECK